MPAPPVDFVLVFRKNIAVLSKQQAVEEAQNATAAYSRLIKTLSDANFKVTGRRGEKDGEILVLVWTPPTKLAELVQATAYADFLLNLPSSTPGRLRDLTASPLTPNIRLRLAYDHITSLKVEGGLGIIPGIQEWSHVHSILALHDDDFNRTWIKTWTTQRRGFNLGFSELTKIRDEFGEAVALYFAFLSSYTQALFFPTALGVLFWLFASPYSSWYSILLGIWSICWVEWWRIRQRALSVRWGTLGSFRGEKRRPEFRGGQGNSTLGRGEEAFPWWKRELRIVSSLPMILIFGGILGALLTAIFIFEAFVTQLYQGPFHQYISLAPTVLFVALVPRVLAFYQTYAQRLTHWENHAHKSNHDASLTIKTFALSAIVAYLGLALSAFVYVPFGQFAMGYVQNYVINGNFSEKGLFNASTAAAQSKIDPSRLQKQMFAYTVTNQIVNTLVEVVLPYVMRGVEDVKNGKRIVGLRGINKNSGFENNDVDDKEDRQFMAKVRHNVSLPEYTLFGDYSEMVTQYGYVTLWSTIWPLAPMMALLNNWLELRSDAFKITTHSRRPLPMRVDTIGPWLDSMAFISWLGALTNAALVYLFHPQTRGAFSANFSTALKPGDQPDVHTAWHDLMMPALLVALASSYGYLLARGLIRYIMNRAVWDVSPENIQLEASQNEVKAMYLNKMKDELVDSDAIARMAQLAPGSAGDDAFWTNDEGVEELRQAAKTV
ncbi:DUF590-domain-containing protein [Hysterangium stoloniferum]|nr:DUF590-domain-containing protein [Hysterangium stoloniferum]